MRVLVTGATGFIGRALCRSLGERGHSVFAAVRLTAVPPPGTIPRWVGDLRGPVDWSAALQGIDAVVHLSGYVHIEEADADLLAARRVNVEATASLARQALAAGVRSFVFASSIKVYGDYERGHPFDESDAPAPDDAYGQSKWEAEQTLAEVVRGSAMAVCILRLPLVHGPGVKANLRRFMRLVDGPWPLPLGSATNERSMLGTGNLADAVDRWLQVGRPGVACYVMRDRDDLSISDFSRLVRRELDRPERLLSVPRQILKAAFAAIGRHDIGNRLFDSLRVDDAAIRRELEWAPAISSETGIAAMVGAYRRTDGREDRPRSPANPASAERETKPGVSVVTVSYRTGPSLELSIERALAEAEVIQVIVTDNGNPPATVERLRAWSARDPRLVLITGHGNVGFAAGCNLGASYATGSHILLLNPDCLLEPGAVRELLDQMARRYEPWVATVRLVGADGREQRGSRRNLATPLTCLIEGLGLYCLSRPLRRWRLNLTDCPLPKQIAPVPAISGAFMLMPESTFRLLRGMDERYFLHVEDLDFCYRLAEAGGTAWFEPRRSCVHLKGTSDMPKLFVEFHKARGLQRYFTTHFVRRQSALLIHGTWMLLGAGLLAKAVLMKLLPRFRNA